MNDDYSGEVLATDGTRIEHGWDKEEPGERSISAFLKLFQNSAGFPIS
jgi:hypothetical protein